MAEAIDKAYANLAATKEYVLMVADMFPKGVKEKWLDGKESLKPGGIWRTWADTVEMPFVAYYNIIHGGGIALVDVDGVNQTCTKYKNDARGYHERLVKLSGGGNTLPPVPPEEKPPPGVLTPVGEGLSDIGKGLLAVGVAVGLYMITRK